MNILKLLEIRKTAEKQILQAARRGDLSTTECLAIWKMANDDLRMTIVRKKRSRRS